MSREIFAQSLGLEDTMVRQSRIRDSGKKTSHIVLRFAMTNEEQMHRFDFTLYHPPSKVKLVADKECR